MAVRFGKKFEDVYKLFDHVVYNGSNYLNGHCFVSVCSASRYGKNRIHCLSVPLGYRMRQKKESCGIYGSAGYAGVHRKEKRHHL